jgi:hypothetical protein
MGRRGRARARAAEAEAGAPAGQTMTSPTGWQTRQRLLRWLNPAKRRSRGRARFVAVVFGLVGLMLVGAALTNDRPALLRPAFLLGVVAVIWALRAVFMDEEPEA